MSSGVAVFEDRGLRDTKVWEVDERGGSRRGEEFEDLLHERQRKSELLLKLADSRRRAERATRMSRRAQPHSGGEGVDFHVVLRPASTQPLVHDSAPAGGLDTWDF